MTRSRFNDVVPKVVSVPNTDRTLVILDDVEGWRVQWTCEFQNGVPVVRDLTLSPADADTPLGGITSNLLRELSPLRASGHAVAVDNASLQDALRRLGIPPRT